MARSGSWLAPSLLVMACFGHASPSRGTTFELVDPALANAWVEVTDLLSGREPDLLLFENGAMQAHLEMQPERLVLICAGAAGRAITCEQRFLDPDEELPLTFSRGAAVVGTCFEGGEPTPGAEISAVPQGLRTRRSIVLPLYLEGDELARTVTADKNGRFRLPELAPGSYLLEIHFPSGRLLHSEPFTVREPPPRRRTEPTEEQPQEPEVAVLDLGRLEVQQGESVAFFVVDVEGQPVEGALVGGGQGDRPEDLVTFEGRTDTEGRAVVSGFRNDRPVRLTCHKDGYTRESSEHELVPAVRECRLLPLVTIVGRVLDGEEEPLDGATVAVEGSRQRARTNGDGDFELIGLSPEAHTLQVAAPGFVAEEVAVELLPGEKERELGPVILQPAPALTGRVVDAETEAPVPGAEIEVTDPPGLGTVTADAEGAFVLEAASRHGLGLRVSAPGYAAVEGRIPAEDLESGEEVELELSRGGRIRIRVWDEDEGGPCIGCEIWLSGAERGRLHTNEEGVALTEPLAPGGYGVQRPHGQMLGSLVVVESAATKRVEVRAGQTAEVELGEPTVIQLLELEPSPPPGWRVTSRSPTRVDSHRPSSTGQVELRRRPGELLTLHLAASGLAGPRVRLGVLPPADRSGRERLRLPETVLGGKVVRGEEPVAQSLVTLVSVEDGLVWGSARTDADGRFAIPFTPPGTYLLQVDDQLMQTVAVGRDERRDLGELQAP